LHLFTNGGATARLWLQSLQKDKRRPKGAAQHI